jgi:hypothetical protein
MTTATTANSPRWWVPGDWHALFGFGTNILVNVLVLTGLLLRPAAPSISHLQDLEAEPAE